MRHTDPKIDRLQASWLALDTDDATWLASVADEVPAAAGTRIGHRRFVHLVLSGPDAGLVVDAGAPPATLRGDGAVLVLTVSDTRELDRRREAAARPAPLASPSRRSDVLAAHSFCREFGSKGNVVQGQDGPILWWARSAPRLTNGVAE